MENQKDNIGTHVNNKRKQRNKYFAGVLVVIMTLITTLLVHTNPKLNMADLTETASVVGDLTDVLYIPNYAGGIGEEGLLEVKTKTDISTFDSITFAMNYSPVDALIFDNNPIVFDTDTEFDNVAFQMTASPEPGKLITTIVRSASAPITDPIIPIVPATTSTHKTLFKLKTKLNTNVAEGQDVTITFDELALLDGPTQLTGLPTMPATKITVEGQNELQVLKAQAIDSTHVAITFSDYLSNMGNDASYTFDPALVVSDVEVGTGYGFDQKTVVLTTAAQTPGQTYTIDVDELSTINSNQQGKINNDYSIVLFEGFGDGTGVLSDFGFESASVTGYNSISVVFSDVVRESSVSKTDFTLTQQGGGAITIDNVSEINGSQIILAVSTPLLEENTYILSAVSTASILRDSDDAELGMDRVTFAGNKNGPKLIGASITDESGTYRLQLTFDEAIQVEGSIPNDPIGRLYTTGAGQLGTQIDNTQLGVYNHSISGSTITVENAVFNDPDTNFTFSVSAPTWLENSLGVPVDDSYKTISFWGYGHNDSLNTTGTAQVVKKDAILLPDGNLDFSAVVTADVSVLYDSGGANLASEAVQSINVNGDGDLEVVMGATLNPDRHYVLRIVDNTIDDNTLAAKRFVMDRELSVASAEAISSTNVRVTFSEAIDENDVDFTDFTINDGGIAVSAMTIDPSYESVVLTTAGPFTAGSIFKVNVTGVTDVFSFDGNAVLKSADHFTGYQTVAAKSDVTLQSATAVDAQTLRLVFSDEIDDASFTPVNLDIFYYDVPGNPGSTNNLVVTSITQVTDTSYDLSTAVQASDKNYFVIFDGVTDLNGLLIGNANPVNFFGFALPEASINLVTPSVVSNEFETNVVVSGENLDLISEVRIGNDSMTIVSQTASSLVFTVPADFEDKLYDITLIDNANNSHLFSDALLVTPPEQDLIVHSAQSQSIPLNVANNGTAMAKLWLLVEDPVSLASVSSVVVDLSQIGGPSTQAMVKDTGTQPLYSQWYTFETTVPATVATKDEAYLLPVEVRRRTDVYTGTISVRVTNDVTQSVAPVIDSFYISPLIVPPDGTTPIKISAQVTDQDGAGTINSVVADLGALGIGFKQLTAIGELTEGQELETRFYESEEFTVPEITESGTYTVNVIASDTTGEQVSSSLTLTVSTETTGPQIDGDISYVSPRLSIPNDEKTEFALNVFVSDSDGIADIQSVTATFGTIGIAPVALTKSDGSGSGETAWYTASGLTIPKTSPLGTHDIEVRAADSTGGIANTLLRIEVTHRDTLGDPPRLVEDRAYTTPRVAINDGETAVTLYAFIRDDDDDIESVIANLSEIGQVGTENPGVLGQSDATTTVSNGACPTGSNVLVCMQPSVKEGDNGRWFILPDVVVNTITTASPNPYQIEIIATDSGG